MAKFSKIVKESNENLLISKFIEIFKTKLNKKLKLNKRFSFVMTGGKSPIKLYKQLVKIKNIKWKSVDFFISDERHIKETSKDSNINLCKKYLLNKIKISRNQIFKISTKNDLKKDAKNYENKIKKYFFNKKISFDLVLLGIGNDGHIASLFKNNVNRNNKKIVDYIKRKDFSRITLSIKCINNSSTILLWAPSKKKSFIIKKILSDKMSKYPASYLKKENNTLFYSN